ncbi:hypothetical protein C1645_821076 [Glomus cerebriforme]|uniref:BTB/POZ protein n=1 Tax=Glomus cerebriforme TaxID=658196 RepID=A0A397T7G1_9GLOM|nr:hypothetical protein C1645_821076 [Glomus cerebriforme]
MTFEYSQEVVDDLENLFETEEGCDVIIYAGENENVKKIYAHSSILRTRSQYFRAAFSNEWAVKKDGKFIFRKPNISPQFFTIILRFIYCGKIDLTELQGPDVLNLLITVDELNIQTLISCIQEYLVKNKDKYLQQNPIEILEAVHQHESFTDLLSFCIERICIEPETLFNSDKFIRLKASLLELLLKRDDLLLDEIDIWDNLIRWCLAQHSNISQDVTKWNKEEIIIMERTIHKFIPLIRFYYISSDDFIRKIYPFKRIIQEDLIDDILFFHMAKDKKQDIYMQSPRGLKFNSVIIKPQHFAIFASWIEKKNYSHYHVRNIPYNFNLLYRSSKDGDAAATFHKKCDYKGSTLTVAKIRGSEQIVGGYNPLNWNSTTWVLSSDSFIFSFINRTNLQTAKISYKIGNPVSWQLLTLHGPIFSNDLQCRDKGWSSEQCSYSNVSIPRGKFYVDDYEVFQVIKK